MHEPPQLKQVSIHEFFINLMRDTAQGIQKKVCEKNAISLVPKSGDHLCPIPVFEDAPASLLLSANVRRTTVIRWATTSAYDYLPAYYKRIKDERGHSRNEIVVVTNNYCYARFFAAKELMHCFMDDDWQYYESTNTPELVNELIESLASGSNDMDESRPQTIIDRVAWLGASEYLVPTTWIPMLVKVYEAIVANSPTTANPYFHLAQKIRVPETVLRIRLRGALKEPR